MYLSHTVYVVDYCSLLCCCFAALLLCCLAAWLLGCLLFRVARVQARGKAKKIMIVVDCCLLIVDC